MHSDLYPGRRSKYHCEASERHQVIRVNVAIAGQKHEFRRADPGLLQNIGDLLPAESRTGLCWMRPNDDLQIFSAQQSFDGLCQPVAHCRKNLEPAVVSGIEWDVRAYKHEPVS